MKSIAIHNLHRPGIQPLRAVYCASFLCRARGLTFRRHLPPQESLVLVYGRDSKSLSSIHMMFCFIDLAVVWINSSMQVVDVKLARKWRLSYVPQNPACYVLEMNTTRLDDFQIGDKVSFSEI
jgi:hypothetical protein